MKKLSDKNKHMSGKLEAVKILVLIIVFILLVVKQDFIYTVENSRGAVVYVDGIQRNDACISVFGFIHYIKAVKDDKEVSGIVFGNGPWSINIEKNVINYDTRTIDCKINNDLIDKINETLLNETLSQYPHFIG